MVMLLDLNNAKENKIMLATQFYHENIRQEKKHYLNLEQNDARPRRMQPRSREADLNYLFYIL